MTLRACAQRRLGLRHALWAAAAAGDVNTEVVNNIMLLKFWCIIYAAFH